MTDVNGLIGKIEALFKQAANTSFPEEAATFQAKAQELMTKYQIEEAMLNNRVLDDELTVVEVKINNPYFIDKCILLNSIAKHNYCRVVRYGYANVAKVYGYSNDIKMVVAMYTSLEMHMIAEMWVAYKQKPDYASTVSWKKSFFTGYSKVIGSRLAKAKRESINDADKFNGNNSVSLVLVKKDALVDEYFNNTKGYTTSSTRTLTSLSGMNAGGDAGNRANIGQASMSGSRALGR